MEEKVCKSCKYYVEHYIIRNSTYHPIGGHCINDVLNAKHNMNRFRLYENCEHWELDTSKKVQRRKSIQKVLHEMNEHLRQIELILKDEE